MAEEQTKYALFGVGNALLDVSAVVGEEIFENHGIKPNNAVLVDEKPHWKDLFDHMHGHEKKEYISGGATLNAIRVANWMLDGAAKCSYVSILGSDEHADTFISGCKKEGLDTSFARSTEQPTGQCAVCLNQSGERSLVAALNACNVFPTDPDYLFSDSAKPLHENAEMCYVAGFWLTVNVQGMMKLSQQAKKFCMNISAPFLCQFFFDPQMKSVLPNVDILFGNESEAEALAGAINFKQEDKSKEQFMQDSAAEFLKHIKEGGMVVITQGKDPTIIATKDGVETFKTPVLEQNKIVDTNGAGDAFVGGFLAATYLKKDTKTCVAWGNAAAQFIIQQSGTQFKGQDPPSKSMN